MDVEERRSTPDVRPRCAGASQSALPGAAVSRPRRAINVRPPNGARTNLACRLLCSLVWLSSIHDSATGSTPTTLPTLIVRVESIYRFTTRATFGTPWPGGVRPTLRAGQPRSRPASGSWQPRESSASRFLTTISSSVVVPESHSILARRRRGDGGQCKPMPTGPSASGHTVRPCGPVAVIGTAAHHDHASPRTGPGRHGLRTLAAPDRGASVATLPMADPI